MDVSVAEQNSRAANSKVSCGREGLLPVHVHICPWALEGQGVAHPKCQSCSPCCNFSWYLLIHKGNLSLGRIVPAMSGLKARMDMLVTGG